jgi:hypothetical protein
MKAITIRHPCPWAICYLGKPLENRDWRPALSQLRPGEKFAIHAGKMPSTMEIRGAFEGMSAMGTVDEDTKFPTLAQLHTQESSIVAVATYGGHVGFHPSKWFVGLYGWKLLGERDDVPLIVLPDPVKCRGARGLWNVPSDVLAKMRAQFTTREEHDAGRVPTVSAFLRKERTSTPSNTRPVASAPMRPVTPAHPERATYTRSSASAAPSAQHRPSRRPMARPSPRQSTSERPRGLASQWES